MSQWVALLIAMAAACVVVISVVVLRQRRIAEDDDPTETPDVIEYMTMMIGVIYAIVLGWRSRASGRAGAPHRTTCCGRHRRCTR